MVKPQKLEKARMQAIRWVDGAESQDLKHALEVQFNPETLKLSYTNQNAGGDQSGGGAKQYVAKGSTKLSFDLWVDVSAPHKSADGQPSSETDVRKLTELVNKFMQPDADLGGAPPGVRFLWGTFLFEGVMESMNENLELFSEEGKPLRAMVSIVLAQQEIQFAFHKPNGGAGAGTQPNVQAREGDTVQSMAARAGRPNDWQQMARANDIENPRSVPTGALLTPGG